MPGPVVVIGGLGGGGDVGLALLLAQAMGLKPRETIVASFLRCSVKRDRLTSLSIEGSLIKVPPGYFADKRMFEDKIHLVEPGLAGRVYAICTEDPWSMTARGLSRLLEVYRPRCMIHTDLGGDGVLLGYEESLGSYTTDTVARALLYWAAREHGAKTLIAAGCVGCEGGGTELDDEWLAASLLYADRRGALVGVMDPPTGAAGIAAGLLGHAESGMLPFYLAALRGEEMARIRMAYLSGEYPVEPWYRHVFILDGERHCSISPLCMNAVGRGVQALREYRRRRPRPPRELENLLSWTHRAGAGSAFARLSRRRISVRRLYRECTG